MSTQQKAARPGKGAAAWQSLYLHRHSTSRALPNNWRDRLPDSASYYVRLVEKLGQPNASGWAQGRCPFHDDTHASLSVNLASGGFTCFACGAKGDLLTFHMRATSLPFKRAVRDLLGLRP